MQKLFVTLVALACYLPAIAIAEDRVEQTSELRKKFHEQTGIELVFDRADLPKGVYHDLMPSLSGERQEAAFKILSQEAAKLPPRFLRDVGLRAVGVFESCASRQGDGFRPFDKQLKGYRYFGVYNGQDAIAGAYYTDEQLPLTFHHESFHHVDRITSGNEKEDERLKQILAGENLYSAPAITPVDLAALKKRSQGHLLISTVSEYAAKNQGEDKAETARYLMSLLPDSLVQVVEQPKIAGSQRILHVLAKYRAALEGQGPTVDWFVDVALDRRPDELSTRSARELAVQLRAFGAGKSKASEDSTRRKLQEAERLGATRLDKPVALELVQAAALATQRLLTAQIVPGDQDRKFFVAGREDADGVNWALRNNIKSFGHDAARLGSIGNRARAAADKVNQTQLQNLRLVARFYVFIDHHWKVTDKTRQIFEETRDQFAASVAASDPALEARLGQYDLAGLAESITPSGALPAKSNPYSKVVDAELKDPSLRLTMRSVQPACVRFSNGSGVNISRRGRILTAGHVAGKLDAELSVTFPDGRKFDTTCSAIDTNLDLAICSISTDDRLPLARVDGTLAKESTPVVCIGQPGERTPTGEPTGYQPFNVSAGQIRGFVGRPLGPQRLGGVKHDAWTYWGHSGSPLFNHRGLIVAMHNSWDPETAMRHAVTQQAILKFLKDNDLADAIVAEGP